jgi:hypothetical protein
LKKKVLILKNDRTGDLFVSHKAINRILSKHCEDEIIMFLSNINYKFNFLFPNISFKTFPMYLNIFHKLKIILYLIFNKLDTVYILTPKNFYYYLPFIFRKIKFYAITIKSNNGNRPNKFLNKFLYKTVLIDRSKITKRNSSYIIQESLIENTKNEFLLNKNSKVDHNFVYPDKFDVFHYKHNLFNNLLEWSLDDTCKFLENINNNKKYLLFSSEINDEKINSFFSNRYNTYDFDNNDKKHINEKKIIFLKNIDGYNLFDLINKSSRVICPEGIMTHMAYYLKKDVTALMFFIIKNKKNFIEQVISCKEWFPPENYKFIVLKKNLSKSILKISKRLNK